MTVWEIGALHATGANLMQPSLSVRVACSFLLVCGMRSVGLAESIAFEASAVNTVQIKAIKQRTTTAFEIQLGGGSNQPPADTWITGKASAVVGTKQYSGFYRIATDPDHQLKMQFKGAAKGIDQYSFGDHDNILHIEFAPDASFRNPWLTGRIALTSASQKTHEPRKKSDQNRNQNNENQNGQNGNEGGQNEDHHAPIVLAGKLSALPGGKLEKHFGSGDCQLSLNVGGNQELSVLQLGNTLSGMSLQQGSLSPTRQ